MSKARVVGFLQARLEILGIRLDAPSLYPTEDLKKFIKDTIKESDVMFDEETMKEFDERNAEVSND